MHMGHNNYRQCSNIWLEDVCKVLRHNSYCKWDIEATMVCWAFMADLGSSRGNTNKGISAFTQYICLAVTGQKEPDQAFK